MRSKPDEVDQSVTPEGPNRSRVVFFGSYDERLHPRVAVLREGLVDLGYEVTEVNQPLGLSTADKVDAANSISGLVGLFLAIARAWIPLWRRGRKVARPDLVVVGYLGHFDVHLARLIWPRTTIALDHMVGLADTARDRGLAGGFKYRVLDRMDRAALRKAEIIVVDTVEQRALIPDALAPRTVVVPVGATHAWFEQPVPEPPPPLKVCFVGLFTPLQGTPTIGRAIAELADDDRIEFMMVGSGQDLQETVAAAAGRNVTWIDWVDSSELPALVASQHVCLGIFGTTPKAQRVVPNKVYQGLAAGNLVVTSDTPTQRHALGDVAEFVPAGDHEALARCLVRLADDPVGHGVGATDGRRRAQRFLPGEVVLPLHARVQLTGEQI